MDNFVSSVTRVSRGDKKVEKVLEIELFTSCASRISKGTTGSGILYLRRVKLVCDVTYECHWNFIIKEVIISSGGRVYNLHVSTF